MQIYFKTMKKKINKRSENRLSKNSLVLKAKFWLISR